MIIILNLTLKRVEAQVTVELLTILSESNSYFKIRSERDVARRSKGERDQPLSDRRNTGAKWNSKMWRDSAYAALKNLNRSDDK